MTNGSEGPSKRQQTRVSRWNTLSEYWHSDQILNDQKLHQSCRFSAHFLAINEAHVVFAHQACCSHTNQSAPDCRMWGDVVVWGGINKKESTAECCQVCRSFKPKTEDDPDCNGSLVKQIETVSRPSSVTFSMHVPDYLRETSTSPLYVYKKSHTL